MATLFTEGKFQGLDSSGNPLSGGKLYTYEAGTLTNKATYTTQAGTVANANPVVLDSSGRAAVWLGSGAYRMILKTSADVTVWDTDNISGETTSADLAGTASGKGSALIGHIAAGAGSVDRTVQDKLREIISIADKGADLTGATDSAAAIQAAHDAIVASGRKGVLVFNPGTVKCSSGITINTLKVEVQGVGCTLDFSGMTSGVALTIIGNGHVNLGGLRLEGNSATGSVDGVLMSSASAGAPVSVITLRNLAVVSFGRGMVWGDNCYLCDFYDVVIADCFITIDSIATTNAGACMAFHGGKLINQVPGGTMLRNVNPNLQFEGHGTVIDAEGVNFDMNGGSVELHGGLIEPADFKVTPIRLTGPSANFRMVGGKVTAGADPVTAAALVSCDSTAVNGAFFDGVRLDIKTSTRYLVEGTGAANVNFEGCISANRHSLLGNKLADGGFENGAVLYGSADGTSKFADLVAITVDTGGVPAASLVTGTNLALTFSTTHARTGTKSLKCAKSAAVAAPAAFGIFRDISPEGRPSGRIYYKKPGAETGTMAISMGFFRLSFDTNGVPVILRQSLTSAANVVFTSSAVDWTEVGLYDLYVPPWATHYGISINLISMAASSLYFDDAEINIL